MPEGDTVHKLAAYLGPRLVDRTLIGGRVRAAPGLGLAGWRVTRVYAVGKHLFVAFAGGRLLRSHLGMYGSWHRYARAAPWSKPARQAVIELVTEDDVYVCFNAREAEMLCVDGVRRRILDARLGPDLISDAVDDGAVVDERVRAFLDPHTPIADVLLDQRVAAGIGNVYKSEVLFLERQHPATPLAALDAPTLAALYTRARRLLRDNLGGGPRVTRRAADGAGRLWVYRRRGLPCLRCGTAVRSARLGVSARSTYWCPACQPAPVEPAAPA